MYSKGKFVLFSFEKNEKKNFFAFTWPNCVHIATVLINISHESHTYLSPSISIASKSSKILWELWSYCCSHLTHIADFQAQFLLQIEFCVHDNFYSSNWSANCTHTEIPTPANINKRTMAKFSMLSCRLKSFDSKRAQIMRKLNPMEHFIRFHFYLSFFMIFVISNLLRLFNLFYLLDRIFFLKMPIQYLLETSSRKSIFFLLRLNNWNIKNYKLQSCFLLAMILIALFFIHRQNW